MAFISVGEFSDEEKLRILERHDPFRQWRSLDERRYCLMCGEIITGWDIQVIRDKDASELERVICPTEDCRARPLEWVWPTDDVLIRIAMVELERRRLCLIARAGRASQSLRKEKARNTINRARLRRPFA
jgi:hypothetical protein